MKTYTFGAWILVDANGKDIRDSSDTFDIPPDFYTVIDYSNVTESFNAENRFKDKIEKENPGVIFCYGNVDKNNITIISQFVNYYFSFNY